ncbi:hypothetical protein ACIA78_01495 [Streptomyces xanthochromogenes]|uniref:hypothetical protein n=1 Tax=Streptomyces xanthochromogenes TaxID=67384 RepID=UPI0037BA58D9
MSSTTSPNRPAAWARACAPRPVRSSRRSARSSPNRAPGRADDSDITVFDSSGIGLQDLYPGLALLKKMDISL